MRAVAAAAVADDPNGVAAVVAPAGLKAKEGANAMAGGAVAAAEDVVATAHVDPPTPARHL
jgi:hypothetical protein